MKGGKDVKTLLTALLMLVMLTACGGTKQAPQVYTNEEYVIAHAYCRYDKGHGPHDSDPKAWDACARAYAAYIHTHPSVTINQLKGVHVSE